MARRVMTGRMISLYQAPDAESVRLALHDASMPVERVERNEATLDIAVATLSDLASRAGFARGLPLWLVEVKSHIRGYGFDDL